MLASCPISSQRVDSNVVRVISFQVALFSVILLVTQESFFAMVLLFDFFMRSIRKSMLSPFGLIAQLIVTLWGTTPNLCDESPKRFALYLGLFISLFLVIFHLIAFTTTASIIALVLFVCAFSETLFDFCIGCKLYYAIEILKGAMKDDRDI